MCMITQVPLPVPAVLQCIKILPKWDSRGDGVMHQAGFLHMQKEILSLRAMAQPKLTRLVADQPQSHGS